MEVFTVSGKSSGVQVGRWVWRDAKETILLPCGFFPPFLYIQLKREETWWWQKSLCSHLANCSVQMTGCWLINHQHPTKGPWWWGRKCIGGESPGPHQQTFLRWKICMWWWITNSTKSLCMPVLMSVGWRVLVMKTSVSKNQHLCKTHCKVLDWYFKPEFLLSSYKKMCL